MKKLFFILLLAIFSVTIFAQDRLSFGVAKDYQVKNSSESWGGWVEAESPILIYMDLGFGFIAVENGYHDRFILNSTILTTDNSDVKVFTIKAIDQTGKECTIEANFFVSGNFALTVRYSDIQYSYLIEEDMGAIGYPYKYFENKSGGSPVEQFDGITI
jgi:hypothetical protein